MTNKQTNKKYAMLGFSTDRKKKNALTLHFSSAVHFSMRLFWYFAPPCKYLEGCF